MRAYADRGRTVLVSSHGLAEVAQLADEAVVIARGRLRAHASIAELVGGDDAEVVMRTPSAGALADALRRRGMLVNARPRWKRRSSR